jgi:DNA-binding MarR family transcriptional regulator
LTRKIPPSRFVDGYLAALLARASHLISAQFHAVVKQHGFSVSEWRTLATLSDGDEISIGRLARITLTKQPTLTRLLDRMQRRGQLARVPHGRDGRITLIRITAKGRRTVQQLIQLAEQHEKRVLHPFGLARSRQLKATLRGIIRLHAGEDT